MLHHLVISTLLFSQITHLNTPQFDYPVANHFVVSPYLAPQTKYSAGHRGIDFNSSPDEEIHSPVNGQIGFSGKVGFRNLITIKFEDREVTLEPVCSEMTENTEVLQGQIIGHFCSPDPEYQWHCENCIHLGLKTPAGYLSPEIYLSGLSPSRLLP